jgi:hypothetical protein
VVRALFAVSSAFSCCINAAGLFYLRRVDVLAGFSPPVPPVSAPKPRLPARLLVCGAAAAMTLDPRAISFRLLLRLDGSFAVARPLRRYRRPRCDVTVDLLFCLRRMVSSLASSADAAPSRRANRLIPLLALTVIGGTRQIFRLGQRISSVLRACSFAIATALMASFRSIGIFSSAVCDARSDALTSTSPRWRTSNVNRLLPPLGAPLIRFSMILDR